MIPYREGLAYVRLRQFLLDAGKQLNSAPDDLQIEWHFWNSIVAYKVVNEQTVHLVLDTIRLAMEKEKITICT